LRLKKLWFTVVAALNSHPIDFIQHLKQFHEHITSRRRRKRAYIGLENKQKFAL
jgi:hypothetical protein